MSQNIINMFKIITVLKTQSVFFIGIKKLLRNMRVITGKIRKLP